MPEYLIRREERRVHGWRERPASIELTARKHRPRSLKAERHEGVRASAALRAAGTAGGPARRPSTGPRPAQAPPPADPAAHRARSPGLGAPAVRGPVGRTAGPRRPLLPA